MNTEQLIQQEAEKREKRYENQQLFIEAATFGASLRDKEIAELKQEIAMLRKKHMDYKV